MGRLITNKHKQAKRSALDESPSRWEKQQTARLLRREAWGEEVDEPTLRSRPFGRKISRKERHRCPVCKAKLRKIGRGTRYQRNCETCGAVHQKHLLCTSCSTNQVWAGRLGRWCNGCGKVVVG